MTFIPSRATRSRSAGPTHAPNGGTFEAPETLTPRRITTRPEGSTKCRPAVTSGGGEGGIGGTTTPGSGRVVGAGATSAAHAGADTPPNATASDAKTSKKVGTSRFK